MLSFFYLVIFALLTISSDSKTIKKSQPAQIAQSILSFEVVQMLKLAYIVQGDKMHNYALCLLEQFALFSCTVFDSLTISPFELFNQVMHFVRLSFLNWFDHLDYLCI